ncbi:putative amidohydrolase [Rhodobium orientis]|uniref:Amidohydrolase n=1 Tax=Rhodobium orientis TaxID=34017 RepID=A0A327JW95_9HYPH|nr:carbon-nitrogen hydrolase family protein [Rhodobium orientis]MBB4302789.1 putative amidohydrolase [Rhodobium orientis]MBK5948569.1 amidohydrolase [Rhodobium orientis]RAI29834.1 amidohydrolase [Rhodobium orientis]
MPKSVFRAAVVQTLAKLGDFDHNITLMTTYVAEAVRQGAELVVLPECMDTGYLFDSPEHCAELAEQIPGGPFVTAMAGLCKKHGIYIASGITEKDGDKIFNTGLMLDRDGQVAVHYHKQFLATHDQNWFAFGERGCPVVDTDLGRIGLLICFDGRIPEIARSLALQGAEVIVDMANFFAMDQADMWGPARAFENGIWLVAATKAGYERSIYYPGGSMIADPEGRVVTSIPYDTHGVAVADIDLAAARHKRVYGANNKISDRRPDAYGILKTPYDETPVAKVVWEPIVPAEATSKVAAVQSHVADLLPGPETTGADDVFDMLDHTAKLGVKVLCLPEYAFSPAWVPDAAGAAELAKAHPSHVARAAGIAARYGCVIAVPGVLKDNGRLFPATTLVGPDGVIGSYRKVHLTAEEEKWASAGADFPVFETPFGRVGIMMGYDGLFPEASRCLGVAAADIVLWPAALRTPQEREWLTVPRAADNRVALVLANRLDCPYPGGSLAVPPNGFPHWDINVVAPKSLKMGAVMPMFVDLAVCRQKQMIPKVDMFANRLTATYGPLVEALAVADVAE